MLAHMPLIDAELLFKGVLGPRPVYLRSVVLRDFLSQHENFVIPVSLYSVERSVKVYEPNNIFSLAKLRSNDLAKTSQL